MSSGDALTLTASDQHDSLLWSRDASKAGGHQHVWSPYGSGDTTDLLPGFNGERADPVSGTYHLGNGYRAYNPVLMRFNCPDSLSPFGAGGINPYAYCAGDPVNHIDPSGHLSWQGILGIVTGAVGLALSVFTAGASIAAAGGVMAALGTATSLVVGGLGVAADVTAIASGAAEESNPQASSVLGWVSMGLGLTGLAAGATQSLRGIHQARTLNRGFVRFTSEGGVSLHAGSTRPPQGATGILSLPDETIRKIGTHLPMKYVRNFRLASSRMAGAITERDILSRLDNIRIIESYQYAVPERLSRASEFFESFGPGYGEVAHRMLRLRDYAALNTATRISDIDKEMIDIIHGRIISNAQSLTRGLEPSQYTPGSLQRVFMQALESLF